MVRRPPLGHVLATAHDMGREYRVITALRDTSVPVPLTYALCTDPDVLGAPFYVMSKVDGIAYRTADQLAGSAPTGPGPSPSSMIDTLARLHAVIPAEVGLADFGRPEGFLARQVRRWKKQLDASRSRPIARHRRAARAAGRQPCPTGRRPRSCTATTGSTTCWSAPTTRWPRWWTGRWPPWATR